MDFKWSEIFSSSSDEDEENFANEQENIGESSGTNFEVDFEKTEPVILNEERDQGERNCICYNFSDHTECLDFMMKQFEVIENWKLIRCYLNNFINSMNYMKRNRNILNDTYRIAYCDFFYRSRHELLFKLLCLTFNLPETKSDTPFSTLGIDSNRTPDLILELEEIIIVIEVSATSSFERAAVSKGLEEAGFESKYRKELDMLESLGKKYIYVPILFDMSHPKSFEYKNGLNKLTPFIKINEFYSSILDSVKEELCIISIQSKDYLSPIANILFSKIEIITQKHSELSFLYNLDDKVVKPVKIYTEFYISPPVYNKIINNWHRLENYFSNFKDNERLFLVLDSSGHKINCQSNSKGFTRLEYIESIVNNDKLKLFSMLKLRIGRKLIDASDSNDGVKFIETTQNEHAIDYRVVEEILDHPKVEYSTCNKKSPVKLLKYSEMLKSHFNFNYKFLHSDPEFEERLVSMIVDNDNLNCTKDKDLESLNYNLANTNLLSSKELENLDIDELFDDLKEKNISLNKFNDTMPIKINKNKNPFILPIAEITSDSYIDLKHKNISLLSHLKEEISITDPYTYHILDEILCETFQFNVDSKQPSEDYMNIKKEIQEVSRGITEMNRNYYKSQPGKIKIKLKDTQDSGMKSSFEALKNRLSKLNKSLDKRAKQENFKNETQLIRLPSKNKKTFLGKKFQIEMDHYRDKTVKSTCKGVGIRENINNDYITEKTVFDNITQWMTCNAGDNPNLFFENFETSDCNLLKELKTKAVDEYGKLINDVKNSFLGHSCSFISNFAHSLLYYSQMPFNSDYIRVDNLGLKDSLLIVRGGKKIFKSKSSKMYRLLFPVSETITPWIETGKGIPSSTKIIDFDGRKYFLTPWSQLHESILNDSISFYTRVVSFTILNLNPLIDFHQQFPKVSFNVLLAFHNRRQTEVMLANLRYILLSTLGDFTGISDIFDEFLGFNYDCFQSFVRNSVLINYPVYFNNLKTVKNVKTHTPDFNTYNKVDPEHLFTGSRISTEEDLALMIYSTFLMTKAPYQRPTERARNLTGILSIHELFDKTIGLKGSMREFYEKTAVRLEDFDNLKDYTQKIFSNDFYFDPTYCSQIGVFSDSYFNSKSLKDEIFTTWNTILSQSWDEMATSTGLRGRFDDLNNFWGQKGYFIVYKDLIKDKAYMNSIQTLMKIDLGLDKKRKMLRELNIVYKVKLDDVKEYLIFHAVDKVQWRGGREIYVMDIETKTVQQPIEKFLGYLCGKIDNELISIPSDRRAQVIHHSIFEKDLLMKDTLTWYLTLDCSKWAPKSNYLKFITTFLSMTVLPPTFKTHFLNYCQKLFKKRIYFNEAEVEVLKNNDKYKNVIDLYLEYDEVHKGYFLLMPYSWVMGIFNYTSSFLHAMNQKYSEYIIFKTGLISYSDETTLKMFAHSDDSGGRVSCSNKFMLKRCLSLYELQLKMCNHLLSKKKSVVSRFYFEILSVLYLFKKLLALLPKFLGGLRFLPSDKGPAQDMLTSYSKCIEVMVAGASFNIAYLVMKFYSYMVYRFYYHSRKVTKLDFESPVQYLGLPDAHPLMVLLCGSDSDILRLMVSGNLDKLIKEHSLFNKIIKTIDDEGPIRPIKFNISVRGLKKDFEIFIENYKETLDCWSISNVNFHSTPFNFLSFIKKLNDPGFVGSLVNESTTRRISRSYFMRKGPCVQSTLGLITLENLKDLKMLFNEDNLNVLEFLDPKVFEDLRSEVENYKPSSEKQIEVLRETLVSPLRICRYMDDLSLNNKQIVETKRTLKPTHIELTKSSRVFSTRFDPAQMVSYIKEPQFSWALPNIRNLFTGKLEVVNLCEELGFDVNEIDPSTLLKLCRNYMGKHVKSIYLYSQIPGEIRNIRTYSAFLSFLSTNTYSNKEIKGLVLNLKKNFTDPGYLSVNIDEEVYILNNFLSILGVFSKSLDLSFFLSLTINPIKVIDFPGGKTQDFIKFIKAGSKNLDTEHFEINIQSLDHRVNGVKGSKLKTLFLDNSAFYYFPKSQKSKGGWYGQGILTIINKKEVYTFELVNNLAINLESNVSGKIEKSTMSFIFDVLNKCGLSLSKRDFSPGIKKASDFLFGLDYNGDYSLSKRSEISAGMGGKYNPMLNSVLKNKDFYEIDNISPNVFLLNENHELGLSRVKIYTLPLLQGEILNLIRMMFNKNDFEVKLLEGGLNSFEDYILTEIMTDFGFETYVNPYDFLDNFQSSKIYRIFKECKEKSLSVLPNKISNSILPAGEGGLLRILVDYSRNTNEKIIKTPGSLTPEIMELRSNNPESVSVILTDCLIKEHNSIYNNLERMEINESYRKLSKYKNKQEFENNVRKLMTHWGYGSLVNSIENYTLSKSDSNYWYFSLSNFFKINSSFSSELFVSLNKIIITTIYKTSKILNYIDPVVPFLKIESHELIDFLSCYLDFLTNIVYKSDIISINPNIYHLKFLNLILSSLSDEDFLCCLREEMDKNYILCSINVDFQSRKKFVAFYNTLFYTYVKTNNQDYELNFVKKNERLPVGISNPKTKYDLLTPNEISGIEKYQNYYFNFLNDDLISFMSSTAQVFSNGIEYRINQKVSGKSIHKVPVCDVLPLKHVYNPKIFDCEDWEEVMATINMGDADQEDIDYCLDNIKEKYLISKTKKLKIKNPVIISDINWIIDPHTSCKSENVSYYRQCGENIIVVTTEYLSDFLEFFPNSQVRLVNFSKRMKRKCKDFYCHISFNKMLDDKFIDKMIGGKKIEIYPEMFDHLYYRQYLINENVIGKTNLLGKTFQEIFKLDEPDNSEEPEMEETKKAGDKTITEEELKEIERLEFISKVKTLLDEALERGVISRRLRWRLMEKYTKNDKLINHSSSLEELFLNCLNEVNLIDVKENLIKGEINLFNKEDYVKVFIAPTHFGMANSYSRGDNKNIKDKKVSAELDSICKGLSRLIASGSWSISSKYLKLFKSHFNLWVKVTRGSNHKRENKRFLLLLILTVINSAQVFEESNDDYKWRDMVDLFTPYFSNEGEDECLDDEEFLSMDIDLSSSSRLLYRVSGF